MTYRYNYQPSITIQTKVIYIQLINLESKQFKWYTPLKLFTFQIYEPAANIIKCANKEIPLKLLIKRSVFILCIGTLRRKLLFKKNKDCGLVLFYGRREKSCLFREMAFNVFYNFQTLENICACFLFANKKQKNISRGIYKTNR